MRSELSELRRQFNSSQRVTTLAEREKLSTNAELAAREPLGEAQVRQQLDRMLADAGWSVQDAGVGQDLWAARGVAIREVTTKAGRADYLLYVDRKLVGVIEAKREGADLTAAEQQADELRDRAHRKPAPRRMAPGTPVQVCLRRRGDQVPQHPGSRLTIPARVLLSPARDDRPVDARCE